MTTLTILRGLPGSGKTTRARELVADDPRCARVNRDDLRMMMFGAKVNLTPDQERAVTLAEHAMARALLPNWNVVTDDMNLRPRYVRDWLSIAAQRGADVVMVEMPTPLDECIDRDAQRDAPVSADVIRRIAAKFLPGGRFLPIPDDPPSPTVPQYTQTGHLPPAVIVDIDGTLALKGDRSPYDMTRVGEDTVNWPVAGIVHALSEWYDIVYCSGRSEDARAATEQWLRTNDLSGPLYMRAEGDIRRDSVVKRELLDRIGEFYDVQAAIDDRQQVVDMWRAAGLLCLQVAPGDF